MHLHHTQTLHVQARARQVNIKLPARKHVECRSRDLHQSLLVKLSRAMARHRRSTEDEPPAELPLLQQASLAQGGRVWLLPACLNQQASLAGLPGWLFWAATCLGSAGLKPGLQWSLVSFLPVRQPVCRSS